MGSPVDTLLSSSSSSSSSCRHHRIDLDGEPDDKVSAAASTTSDHGIASRQKLY
jgi:hypothetical protein